MKKGLRLLIVFALCSQLLAPSALWAADKNKTFGGYVSFNGDPGPSAMGLNFAIQTLYVFRLSAGLGGYNSALGAAGPAAYNFTVAPIVWLLSQIVTLGLWKPGLNYFRLPYPAPRSSFSYGGGLQVLPLLGSRFSPSIGAHSSWITTHNKAYGISGKKTVVYYSGGVDWMADGGLNLAGGLNFYPSLKDRKLGLYFNVGVFF